ncbi:hypothetical protein HRG84_07740 [Flavisolibacter sp. BT320]|nr:hypothetical protein [Flavisolibacter longurius]
MPAEIKLNEMLLREEAQRKKLLEEFLKTPPISYKWRPRKEVMEFLDYGDTQMGALEKSGDLVVSRIGNRKFIDVDSVLQLLERNIQKD